MAPDPQLVQAARWDAHPQYWYDALDQRWGPAAVGPDEAWLLWDPDTVRDAIHHTTGQALSEAAEATIQALLTCIVSSAPWRDPRLFGVCCIALADGVPDPEDALPVPSPSQLIFGARTMVRIDQQSFSQAVVHHQAACLLHHGLVAVQEPALMRADGVLDRTAPPHRGRTRTLITTQQEPVVDDDDDAAQVAAARWWCGRTAADLLDAHAVWHPQILV